jgi:hypothetical protein
VPASLGQLVTNEFYFACFSPTARRVRNRQSRCAPLKAARSGTSKSFLERNARLIDFAAAARGCVENSSPVSRPAFADNGTGLCPTDRLQRMHRSLNTPIEATMARPQALFIKIFSLQLAKAACASVSSGQGAPPPTFSEVEDAFALAQAMVDIVREPLIVLDKERFRCVS